MSSEELRRWAAGLTGLEAATELLVRGHQGRFAEPGQPWVRMDDAGQRWIDFAAIPDNLGGLSGGERAYLLISASLGAGVPTVLGDMLARLDRDHLNLVLAAVSHAGGGHQHSRFEEQPDGSMQLVPEPSLHPWPESAESGSHLHWGADQAD